MSLVLHTIVADKKALISFVDETITAYKTVAVALHQAACMTIYHAAEYRECSFLNAFYNGLRVNDQTALRVWVGKNFLVPVEGTEKPTSWINYSKDKGFHIRKGVKSEGLYELDTLLVLDPFYNKNVKEKDAITLEAILAMLHKAAERADKQADDEGINLPDQLKTLLKDVKHVTDTLKVTVAPNPADRSNVVVVAKE